MLKPLRQGPPPIDPCAAAGAASCALPARYEAVRGARQFTRTTLGRWGLAELFDDVSLVVSELVTNALTHAVPEAADPEAAVAQALSAPATAPGALVPAQPSAPEEQGGQEPPVRLYLTRWNTRLVCAVRDPSSANPQAREGDEDCVAESGRGLFLVESFSDTWGWHPVAGALSGKVVWALFCLGKPN